jgi:hypothetical protein
MPLKTNRECLCPQFFVSFPPTHLSYRFFERWIFHVCIMKGQSNVKSLKIKVIVKLKYWFQPFRGKSVLVILLGLEKWGCKRVILGHCATSQKVTGLIPDGLTGIFHWHNPSSHTVALGLTQSLTEMSTRNITWG